MEGSIECFDTLICSGARRLTGYQRRLFMAEVTTELCGAGKRDRSDIAKSSEFFACPYCQ